MSPRIKIKRHNKFLDVFHGEQGWETWTRLRIEKKGTQTILHPIKGAHLSQKDANEVMKSCS